MAGHDHDNWLSVARDAVSFQLVASEADIQSEEARFSPEFTHQVFGEITEGEHEGDEKKIFGYRGLNLCLNYCAGSLKCHISRTFEEIYEPTDDYDSVPDDLHTVLREWLPADSLPSTVELVQQAEADFTPPGQLVKSFGGGAGEADGVQYEVYLYDGESPGAVDFHQRLQFFLIWFIDGANYIDMEADDKWKVFGLFERTERGGRVRYKTVGMLSLYEYFAWQVQENIVAEDPLEAPFSSMMRPRISQMLILPPYQRRKLGSKLMQTAYDYCLARAANVVDIAVEDPSPKFVGLRDYVDGKNCLSAFENPSGYFNVDRQFNQDVADEMRTRLLLCKSQARRVFEILQLRFLDQTDAAAKTRYRLAIKKRLCQPHLKNRSDARRREQFLSPEEQQALLQDDDRARTQLQTEYEALVAGYETVVQRLPAD